MTENSEQKSQERKELLRSNKKHFLSFAKGYLLPEIASDLRVRR